MIQLLHDSSNWPAITPLADFGSRSPAAAAPVAWLAARRALAGGVLGGVTSMYELRTMLMRKGGLLAAVATTFVYMKSATQLYVADSKNTSCVSELLKRHT